MSLMGQGFKVVRRGKKVFMYRREVVKGKETWKHAMTKYFVDVEDAKRSVQRRLEDLWYKESR